MEIQEHMNLRNGFTVNFVEQIGKPTMPEDLADLEQDAESPVDEVYQDELEGTGHVSDADADAATLEDLDAMEFKSQQVCIRCCGKCGAVFGLALP